MESARTAAVGCEGDEAGVPEGRAEPAEATPRGWSARLAALALRHRRMAVLVAFGLDDGAVAAECGVEPAAVGRLRASPAFRELVARVRTPAKAP